mgnify:CR=1 FL=1
MSVSDALEWTKKLEFSAGEQIITAPILKEIIARLKFLVNVGLDYLTLDRYAATLSGGEAQRIRLATQIGSGLVGVVYVLDEPSIGLHQRDNNRLISALRNLTDLGNTLVIVEHDEDTMRAADWIVDVGPGAGINGGEIVAQGTYDDIIKSKESITGAFLSHKRFIPVQKERREPKGWLKVFGCAENNLKNLDISIPLGLMTCITGVSGSGKSSFVDGILYKVLANNLNHAKLRPGKYNGIGISIAKDTDTNYPEVVSVFKDQPAYKAGIKNGDLITAIDQKSTADMELQDVVSAIRSEDNDKVVLTIYRDKKTKDYTVEKTSVELDSVTYKMRKNKIGYIAVSQFHENTDEQFDKAVTDLESQGMKSLIIDLRDDGGGLLTTCTNMLSRLVAKDKMLVYTKDKKGKKEEFKSDSGKTVDVPMVVLVNGNTASASEIMTGCLKDYKKATVVGTTTYGKGIVQTILPLTDGSAFKFTIAKYYTPKGTDIHEKGIKPDVEVKMSDKQWKKAQTDEKADKQLKKAIEILRK